MWGLPKIRVGIIFGGRSGEHEVSLMSARNVMEAIDPERFEVVPVGITREGRWLLTGDPWLALQGGVAAAGGLPVALLGASTGEVGRQPRLPAAAAGQAVNLSDRVDVIFPVLHGTYGEDGTIQGLLEMADLPYVGGGVLASALGMDKVMAKTVWEQNGLPVTPYLAVLRRDWERSEDSVISQVEAAFSYPVFVKPVNAGSSVGVGKAKNRQGLVQAMDDAVRYDRKILIEEFVDGREVECSVLGNDDPIASVPGEVVPGNEFYDYRAKYIDDNSDLIIPANLDAETTKKVQETAVAAFRALDCAGMARVDFFVTRQDSRVIINEINTIPGFTKISMYPKLWAASGLSYRDLISRLIDLALERHQDRLRSATTFQA
ncbi:MAG: D-alanine--D-alanine ligase [Symbiobacteriia bacterium]